MNRPLQQQNPRETQQVVSRLTVASGGVTDLPQGPINIPQPTNRRNRHFRQILSPKGGFEKTRSVAIRILPLVRSLERPRSKLPLHLNSSVLNVTISNVSKNKADDKRYEQPAIQNLKTSSGESFENKSSNIQQDKELLLEQILFGTSQCGTLVIQDSEFERSEVAEHLQDGCGCGCRAHTFRTGLDFNNNPIKKRLNKYPTEVIFQALVKSFPNMQSITPGEVKDSFTRWLMRNKITFRFEDLSTLLVQLFPRPIAICFRKLGNFLSSFTQSDNNRVYVAWSKLQRTFISVAELKVMILNNSANKLYEQVKEVFANSEIKDDEDVCYWDLYLRYSPMQFRKGREIIDWLEDAVARHQSDSAASVDVSISASMSASRSVSCSLQLI